MSAVLLLQLGIKVSIVFALAWLIACSMRRASAAARHLVWTAIAGSGAFVSKKPWETCE